MYVVGVNKRLACSTGMQVLPASGVDTDWRGLFPTGLNGTIRERVLVLRASLPNGSPTRFSTIHGALRALGYEREEGRVSRV